MGSFPFDFPIDFGGDGGSSLSGFEVTLFTGTDPEMAENRLRTLEVGLLMREAVLGVDAGSTAKTVRAAVRALYTDGARSLWVVSNSDVIDANTSPLPTRDDLRTPLDLNGRQVFTGSSAPTSGMVTDDLWFDTTPISDGRLRYTPYIYNVSLWEPWSGPPLVVSSLAAFGSVVTDSLAANAVTAAKADIDDLVAAMVTVGMLRTSNYAEDGSGNPTDGAKLDKDGVAIKCAPSGLQIGNTLFRDAWINGAYLAAGQVVVATFEGSGGVPVTSWLESKNISNVEVLDAANGIVRVTTTNPNDSTHPMILFDAGTSEFDYYPTSQGWARSDYFDVALKRRRLDVTTDINGFVTGASIVTEAVDLTVVGGWSFSLLVLEFSATSAW